MKLEHYLCADPSNYNHESIKDTPESTVDKHERVSNSVNNLVIVLCKLPKANLPLDGLFKFFSGYVVIFFKEGFGFKVP